VLGPDTTLRRVRTFGLWFLVIVDAAYTVTAGDHRRTVPVGDVAPGDAPLSSAGGLLSLAAFLLALAVIWRRRYPMALALTGVGASLVALGPTLALVGLTSVVVRHERPTAIRVGAAVALATGVAVWRDVYTQPHTMSFWASMFGGEDPWPWYVPLLVSLALLGLFGGVGLWLRTRAELSTANEVVAEERQQITSLTDQVSRQAERERLAREIHDGLGHNLSILAVHAGALESMAEASGPTAADGRTATQIKESAQVVRETAARSVAELHGLLALLRNPGDPDIAAPRKTLRDVRSLIDESLTADMRLVATVYLDDSEAIDPHIAQAAYRIVQELLTNARKHVPTIPVRLTVSGGPSEGSLVVATANHLPPPGGGGRAGADLAHPGTGLSGIRERVERYGGDMAAGVDPDGVFRVSVRLPWVPPDPTQDMRPGEGDHR
jgi:signal transduction histidine kinase